MKKENKIREVVERQHYDYGEIDGRPAVIQKELLKAVMEEIDIREPQDLPSDSKCETYLDHQPTWDGNHFTCANCGIEFIPASVLYRKMFDLKTKLQQAINKDK